jgi:hypothetical protein
MIKKDTFINSLIKNAKADSALASTININELLENLEDVDNDHLENKSIKSICEDSFNVVIQLKCNEDLQKKLLDILKNYRYVSEIHEIKKHRFTYFVQKNNTERPLPYPRRVCFNLKGIRFTQYETQLYGLNTNGSWANVYLNDYHIFQRLTDKEKLILTAYEKMENGEDLDELYSLL